MHPYTFVARQGFKELLQVADADVRTQPLLSKLSTSLRAALVSANSLVIIVIVYVPTHL